MRRGGTLRRRIWGLRIRGSRIDMDELLEKELLLGVLEEAMDSLMPEERELALKVFGEQVPVSEFAKERGEPRTTVSSRKVSVLGKLRAYFRGKGLDV